MTDYDMELDKVVASVRKTRAKVVGLQLPEGLKDQALELARVIEDNTNAKTIIMADPTYGACDLKKSQAKGLGIDLLVHFGHTRF
jgi:2-(3-amino-3-carboxypropyl)histidine synthase